MKVVVLPNEDTMRLAAELANRVTDYTNLVDEAASVLATMARLIDVAAGRRGNVMATVVEKINNYRPIPRPDLTITVRPGETMDDA